jgi:threonine aldolase
MSTKRGFASDNNAGVHPRVMAALLEANQGHARAYGDDAVTARAVAAIRRQFGEAAEVFFVYGGTGANVTALQALTRPFNAVVCAATSHIHMDECGAPEKFTGCKLLTLPTPDGKLRPEQIEPLLHRIGDPHAAQPRVVSISQPTELGTIYTRAEFARLAEFAHARGLFLHVDGARLANAAAHLNVSLREVVEGADAVSFGGTKNGIMYGEAVVFLNPTLAEGYEFIRKQGMQLASKMRFIAAQFEALMDEDLWLMNAAHANRMAQRLACALGSVPAARLTQQVESNAVFAVLPREVVEEVRREYFFYLWDESRDEVRLMCSFDTTEEDIDGLIATLKRASAAR